MPYARHTRCALPGRAWPAQLAVRDDQRLIQHGPYRWLRHPSYTGALMLFLGMGLALGNVLSLVVLMLPVPLAFLRRIHVEEAALAAAQSARRAWRSADASASATS